MPRLTPDRWDAFVSRHHAAVAVLVAWLLLTSPWVAMLRRVPEEAGFLTQAHVALGLVALVLAATYAGSCVRAGGWRLYFPWATGDLRMVGRDLAGLVRGRIPSADGGGLYAAIEGLLLVALFVTAVTGGGWFAAQGSDAALDWRGWHIVAARTLAALVVLHLLTVTSHLVDFVRDG